MSDEVKNVKKSTAAFEAPFTRFTQWFDHAKTVEHSYAEAMSLATVDKNMMPSVRIVLLKAYDQRGFVFYTNLTSRKAQELSANGKASLLFHWKSMKQQIRIEGKVDAVSDQEADAYFASRPKLSQIGAWASKQSSQLESRFEFEKRIAKYTAKFAIGDVPRPEFWSGFRIVPLKFEFWQDKEYRLHDRDIYERGNTEEQAWNTHHLFP